MFEKLLNDPLDYKLHYYQGMASFKMGKFDEAITHYEQALKYKPSLAMAYNNLAICYNQKGNLEKAKGNDALFRTYKEIAIENYQKGINFEPNTKFYNNLASALSDVDRHQEAIELYNKALQLGPDIYDGGIIMYNLALEYYRIKDTTNFLSTFERANGIPINSASTYERLASMYSKMNLKKEAEILLQKARESKSRGKNGK